MFGSVKYSRLSDGDDEGRSLESKLSNVTDTFSYDSTFTYDVCDSKYTTKNNYNSAFKYTTNLGGSGSGHVTLNMSGGRHLDVDPDETIMQPSFWLVVTSWILTCLSYTFFVLTSPISYWILVKKLGEFDRMVVFRLGKMVGVKGPGRVLVFPWMDRTKRIDVRAAAFAVPPQQFITTDGGIVEMGAEIQYGIVDVVTMISEVADHQDILRSLGKTILVKILVKKTVQQLDRDKRRPASEIQDELNDQVRKWGIDVHKVELSEPKILKQPENSSTTAVGSILKGLGVKSDPKYPTPEEFVRASHGLTDESGKQLEGFVSATSLGITAAASGSSIGLPQSTPSMNMSLLQMMTATSGHVHLGSGLTGSKACDTSTICNWGKCLDVIVQTEFGSGVPLESDALGVYQIDITDCPNSGVETYFIDLSHTSRTVRQILEPGRKCDVTVRLSSNDLASVLDGSLAPLQAFLTGRISANGDVKKLTFFDKLSKRGHKPGSMFSV